MPVFAIIGADPGMGLAIAKTFGAHRFNVPCKPILARTANLKGTTMKAPTNYQHLSRANHVVLCLLMADQINYQRPSRAKNMALWLLQILTATALLMVGFAKLSGQPMMVETFDNIGLGQWFRYLTGGIEVASAILLVIPLLTTLGALLLVCAMIGVVLTHLSLS